MLCAAAANTSSVKSAEGTHSFIPKSFVSGDRLDRPRSQDLYQGASRSDLTGMGYLCGIPAGARSL
jgi:hypothetical protein